MFSLLKRSDTTLLFQNLPSKRFLSLGFNYYNSEASISGCIENANNFCDFFRLSLHFNKTAVLTDSPSRAVTKTDVIKSIENFVDEANPNDVLFFQICGKSGAKGVELPDGLYLSEEEIFEELIYPLSHSSITLVIILDCGMHMNGLRYESKDQRVLQNNGLEETTANVIVLSKLTSFSESVLKLIEQKYLHSLTLKELVKAVDCELKTGHSPDMSKTVGELLLCPI